MTYRGVVRGVVNNDVAISANACICKFNTVKAKFPVSGNTTCWDIS